MKWLYCNTIYQLHAKMHFGGISARVELAHKTASIKSIKSTKSEYAAIAKLEQEAHPEAGLGEFENVADILNSRNFKTPLSLH